MVENASKLSFFYRNPERPFDTERPRNWGSFGAELNGLKPWRRGGFRCFLGGWLMVENASKQSREQAMKRSARARTSTPERNDDSRRATFKRTTETPVRKTLAMPTSGGKAGPENPGSAAGAAALKSGRRPRARSLAGGLRLVTEGYIRSTAPCRRPFCWTSRIPRVDPVSTPARIRSTDFYVIYILSTTMVVHDVENIVFYSVSWPSAEIDLRLTGRWWCRLCVPRLTGLIDISFVLGTEVA